MLDSITARARQARPTRVLSLCDVYVVRCARVYVTCKDVCCGSKMSDEKFCMITVHMLFHMLMLTVVSSWCNSHIDLCLVNFVKLVAPCTH